MSPSAFGRRYPPPPGVQVQGRAIRLRRWPRYLVLAAHLYTRDKSHTREDWLYIKSNVLVNAVYNRTKGERGKREGKGGMKRLHRGEGEGAGEAEGEGRHCVMEDLS